MSLQNDVFQHIFLFSSTYVLFPHTSTQFFFYGATYFFFKNFFLHHPNIDRTVLSNLVWILQWARPPPPHSRAHPRVCCHWISKVSLKRDECDPSRLWRARRPFYPRLSPKQLYLYNNNPIMTFRMHENKFICSYQGSEAASGTGSP